ncbi:MAG: GlmU family protein [Bacteroidia bacterium]|nr:GlmU family protein [Bacteroidia bacterium]
MKTIVLFDDHTRGNLLPFTFTRPVADIRIGILTIREKWEKILGVSSATDTEDYLSAKFPSGNNPSSLWINGSVLPDAGLVQAIKSLPPGKSLVQNELVIASFGGKAVKEPQPYTGELFRITRPWDIFLKNDMALRADFELITGGRKSAPLSGTNKVIGAENIFLEEGARVECAVLNAGTGPVYLAKDSEIMEGSMVRGPFSLGAHSALKMGAKIYGATTVGPHCKVGGEVNNSVIFGYSNKAHDGFLGNSVLGEWVNIGADSNNSNLKNNYAEVKLWNYITRRFEGTGTIFCGLMMGDHSKCGINTMFNTGTVVGVFANVFGSGFPRNYFPSFGWGGAAGITTYKLKDAFETADRVMERRGLRLTGAERDILEHVFSLDRPDA